MIILNHYDLSQLLKDKILKEVQGNVVPETD